MERLATKQRHSRNRPLAKVSIGFVLSLSPRLSDCLRYSFRNPEVAPLTLAHGVMERFRSMHYPDRKIGYLVGVRDRTQHLHAIVTLYPTDERGKLLRVTTEPNNRGGADPFRTMREAATTEYARFVAEVLPLMDRTDARYLPTRSLEIEAPGNSAIVAGGSAPGGS